MRKIIIMIAVLVCADATAFGQEEKKAEKKEETITRVYDVRDFIIEVRDFPFHGEMGMPAEPPQVMPKLDEPEKKPNAETTRRTRAQLVDELLQLIHDTVDPDSWREAGGQIGAIREIGGMLVITQSAENHKSLESLFGQLREEWGVVRVRADWVALRPDQLQAVLKPGDEKKNEAATIDMTAIVAMKEGHFGGEITCLNGQQVSISSGRTRTVIYDAEAVVAQNAVAMNPRVRPVREGAMLEVRPTILRQAGYAIVEVRSQVASWSEPTPVTQGYSATTTRPGDRAITGLPDSAVIDRLNMAGQQLQSTLKVPLNRPFLVGGMTLEPRQEGGEQIYLILQIGA